jgi:peptide deformylase
MALRNIVTEGDQILLKRAKEVDSINGRIIITLDDMLETMRANDGVGIAAPQIGVLKRMFIVEVEGKLIEMVNPKIIEETGSQTGEEGCLSVPGYVGTVERPAYIKMAGIDRSGKSLEVEGTGLLAVALSHEYDHLEGVLYVTKAKELREIGLDEEE